MTIHTGDCVEVMAGMEPDSIDAIVTDPPYGLEFMGKEWDRLDGQMTQPGFGARPIDWPAFGDDFAGYNPTCETCGGRARGARKCSCSEPDWRVKGQRNDPMARQRLMQQWHQRWATEALRVAKPGAYLLAFGGTRTFHRLACAIEDAGWIIRDTLVWAYASGFPKSKASLKPAWEPIVMARKPGPLRMLDIDGCRLPTSDTYSYPNGPRGNTFTVAQGPDGTRTEPVESNPAGRWPANVVLTDPIFDGGWDGVVGGGERKGEIHNQRASSIFGTATGMERATVSVSGTGTYSRFFLISKASRADREPADPTIALRLHRESGDCDKLPATRSTGTSPAKDGRSTGDAGPATSGRSSRRNVCGRCGKPLPRVSTHPTVKPTALMRHLVRLVTPQGGTVLDPFLGSGTTALAATLEDFAWVGIEREAEYVRIAEQRLVPVGLGL